MRWRICAGLVAAAALVLLSACYLPNNFIAEVRLGRNGDYALHYIGEVTWAPLFRDIHEGRVPKDQIPQRVAEIEQDLKRDHDFTKVESLGDGRFSVDYQRQGHLAPSEQVTFVRRNSIILMIRGLADGRVTIDGNSLKPSDAQMVTQMGLSVKGEFRIITDGLVTKQNATSVRPWGKYRLYIWTIDNVFSPSPHFTMEREGAWPSKQENGR